MKKEKNMTKTIMNPIRMRILQFLMLNKKGTTSEISEELSDIPTASLYRHIKILLEADLIEVKEEKKIRGTIQKTYSLKENPTGEFDKEKVKQVINTSIVTILSEFNQYFEKEENDPVKDMLSFSTSTLLMTDEEFQQFFAKLSEIFQGVLANKPSKERKMRRITLISSPCEKNQEEQNA